MKPEEFAKAMSFLGIAYNKEFTKEQVEVWYVFFKDTADEDFRKAISRLINKSKFLPSIAEIKQEIAEINSAFLQLKPDEEWEAVQRAISRYGFYRSDEAMESLNPFTAYVVRHMGGFKAICMSEDGDWTRKNFLRLFEDISDSGQETMLYTEPQMTLPELQRMAELKSMEKGRLLLNDKT